MQRETQRVKEKDIKWKWNNKERNGVNGMNNNLQQMNAM
jgi:hypothetical protein